MLGALLLSYGKDSSYSLYLAKKNNIKVVCLIVVKSLNEDSYMFQKVGVNLIKKKDYFNIPIFEVFTKGEKEKEVLDLKNGIRKAKQKFNFECLISGAIRSTYQSLRVQKICYELGLYSFNPLWQIDEKKYLQDLIKKNFVVMIVKVSSYPLTKEFVSKIIDKKIFLKLIEINKKYGVSIVGEGGEFETICLNSSVHKKKIELKKFKIICENENLSYIK